MNAAALTLVITSVAAFWLQLAGFVAVSRATRSYASEQLSGDSKRARHTILPAWRPLLVGKCYVLAFAAAAATAAAASLIACHAIGAWGAWAWADAAALVGVADAALVPAVVAQDAVTVRAFRRAVALPLLALVIQLGPWAGRYFSSTESSRVAASAVLVVAGGLAPLAASLLILTGRVPSRVRLRSRTHRAAFVLHAVLAFGFALSLGLRLVDAPREAPACGGAAVAVAVAELLLTALIPVAARKTLVADTKYWRGLGKHNRDSELGRATTERRLPAKWTLSLGTWTSFRRSRDLALRPRAEMNLNVASTKLQSIVEEASRKKSLINSDRLKVVEGAVLGAGASATVFRGSYRDQDVAVKAFRPVELCDEDVEKIGREIGIVAGLRHRNVVYLHGLCVRPPAVCAVYEFCDHDLATEIRDRISDKTWTAEARWRCTIDVLSGIAYAHAKGVWHRDVKLENFLVADCGTVKLSDFGESVRRPTSGGLDDDSEDESDDDDDDVKAVLTSLRRETAKTLKRQVYGAPDRVQENVVGTADYLAPELIAAAAHDERVDVYAAGIVLRCVHAGDDRPWPVAYGNFDIFAAVQRGERPSLDGVGSSATKLVESAWRGDAAARPAAAALRDRAVRALRVVAGADALARLRDALHAPRASSLRRPSRVESPEALLRRV